MRSGVLVAVLALAACDAAGAKIEIDTSGDPTIDELRIYVGKGAGAVATITTPQISRTAIREGTYWPRDGGYQSIPVATGQTEIELDLLAGAGADPRSLVVVGMSAGTPTSVAILPHLNLPTDAVTVWTLALVPAAPVSPDDANIAGPRVELWGEEPGKQTCVHVENADPEHPNVWIVHGEDDKDCDGYRNETSEECDDTWWRAEGVVSAQNRDCLVEETFSTNAGDVPGCFFGAAGCKDGEDNDDRSCLIRPAACTPLGVCGACADSDPREGFACAVGVASDLDHRAAITCELDFSGPASSTTSTLCAQKLTTPEPASFFGNLVASCTGTPWFHDAEPASAWTMAPRLDGGEIEVAPGAHSCQFVFEVSPGAPPISQDRLVQPGLISVTLANERQVVMPIRFVLREVQACPEPGQARACTVNLPIEEGPFFKCLENGPQ